MVECLLAEENAYGFESHLVLHKNAGVAQLGEHLIYIQGVGGSSPSSRTIFFDIYH